MGANHQALLMIQRNSVPVLNATFIYSLDRLVATYNGSSFRVRRSSDNTEQDIGFAGGSFDSASLATFVGANDGFVSKWYDQSGNANDLVNATLAQQPMIVDAGTVLQQIYWDGVANVLTSGVVTGVVANTLYIAGYNRITSAANANVEASTAYGNTQTRRTAILTGYDSRIAHTNGNENFPTATAEPGKVYCWQVDRNQVTLPTQLTYWINGVQQTAFDSSGTTVTPGSLAGNGSFSIGASPGGTVPTGLVARSLAVYNAAHNAATILSTSNTLLYTEAQGQLDSFTTNLWGLYGLIRQRSAYAGSCVRVRRSSDNTEQDIGFTSAGYLDTGAMLSFTGVGNGFVSKFYDQSGGGNDLVQATTGQQPQIVSSGAFIGYVRFDGVDDGLQTTNNSGTPTGFSVYFRGILRDSSVLKRLWLQNPADSNNQANCYWSTTDKTIRYYIDQTPGAGTNLKQSSYNYQPDGQVCAVVFDRTLSGSGAVATCAGYSGGTLQSGTSVSNLGSITGNFSAAPWRVGSDPAGSIAAPLDLHTFAVYETAHPAATVRRISWRL